MTSHRGFDCIFLMASDAEEFFHILVGFFVILIRNVYPVLLDYFCYCWHIKFLCYSEYCTLVSWLICKSFLL